MTKEYSQEKYFWLLANMTLIWVAYKIEVEKELKTEISVEYKMW